MLKPCQLSRASPVLPFCVVPRKDGATRESAWAGETATAAKRRRRRRRALGVECGGRGGRFPRAPLLDFNASPATELPPGVRAPGESESWSQLAVGEWLRRLRRQRDQGDFPLRLEACLRGRGEAAPPRPSLAGGRTGASPSVPWPYPGAADEDWRWLLCILSPHANLAPAYELEATWTGHVALAEKALVACPVLYDQHGVGGSGLHGAAPPAEAARSSPAITATTTAAGSCLVPRPLRAMHRQWKHMPGLRFVMEPLVMAESAEELLGWAQGLAGAPEGQGRAGEGDEAIPEEVKPDDILRCPQEPAPRHQAWQGPWREQLPRMRLLSESTAAGGTTVTGHQEHQNGVADLRPALAPLLLQSLMLAHQAVELRGAAGTHGPEAPLPTAHGNSPAATRGGDHMVADAGGAAPLRVGPPQCAAEHHAANSTAAHRDPDPAHASAAPPAAEEKAQSVADQDVGPPTTLGMVVVKTTLGAFLGPVVFAPGPSPCQYKEAPNKWSAGLDDHVAAVAVNICAAHGCSSLLDPCCGLGSILFHAAARWGMACRGVDVNLTILEAAAENLRFMGLEASPNWGPSCPIHGPHNPRRLTRGPGRPGEAGPQDEAHPSGPCSPWSPGSSKCPSINPEASLPGPPKATADIVQAEAPGTIYTRDTGKHQQRQQQHQQRQQRQQQGPSTAATSPCTMRSPISVPPVLLCLGDSKFTQYEADCIVCNLPYGRALLTPQDEVRKIMRNIHGKATSNLYVFVSGCTLKPILQAEGYKVLEEIELKGRFLSVSFVEPMR